MIKLQCTTILFIDTPYTTYTIKNSKYVTVVLHPFNYANSRRTNGHIIAMNIPNMKMARKIEDGAVFVPSHTYNCNSKKKDGGILVFC